MTTHSISVERERPAGGPAAVEFAVAPGCWVGFEEFTPADLEHGFLFGLIGRLVLYLEGRVLRIPAPSLLHTMANLTEFISRPELTEHLIPLADDESPPVLRRSEGRISIEQERFGVPEVVSGTESVVAAAVTAAVADLAQLVARNNPRVLEARSMRWLRDAL